MENNKVPFEGPYTKVKANVKDKSGAIHTPMSRARDLARKAIKQKEVKEAMQKADEPAYLRKQKGEKLTLADVKGPRKDSISSKEALAKARGVSEEAELEEARGRPRKNPAPAKASGDDHDDYGPDKGPEPDQNIHQQLKRAADAKHDEVKGKEGYKTKGGAHVTFASGEKHFVHADHAHKVLSALDKLKPADRSKMHDHIYQSHSNFQAVHKLVG
jgi:hypothetical protein